MRHADRQDDVDAVPGAHLVADALLGAYRLGVVLRPCAGELVRARDLLGGGSIPPVRAMHVPQLDARGAVLGLDPRSQLARLLLGRRLCSAQRVLAGAGDAGLTNLKGHRSVGGMRASIYNAMPMEGVQALIDYMREFERTAA